MVSENRNYALQACALRTSFFALRSYHICSAWCVSQHTRHDTSDDQFNSKLSNFFDGGVLIHLVIGG